MIGVVLVNYRLSSKLPSQVVQAIFGANYRRRLSRQFFSRKLQTPIMQVLTTYNTQHTIGDMIRTQVYLPDQLFHQAKARAALTNSTISQLIRQGLALVLDDSSSMAKETTGQYLLKNFVGKGKGKKGVEAALNHNDIYDI